MAAAVGTSTPSTYSSSPMSEDRIREATKTATASGADHGEVADGQVEDVAHPVPDRHGGAARDVDADQVAVADQRERAAAGRLRRDLADHDALVDQAGKLAVGDHGHLAGQARAVEGEDELGRHAHARRPGRPLAAEHDHLAGLDLPGAHAFERLSRRVEHHGRAGEVEPPVVGHGQLDNPAVRGQAAADQHDRRPVSQGPIRRADDLGSATVTPARFCCQRPRRTGRSGNGPSDRR
jgi:hypothetical protein